MNKTKVLFENIEKESNFNFEKYKGSKKVTTRPLFALKPDKKKKKVIDKLFESFCFEVPYKPEQKVDSVPLEETEKLIKNKEYDSDNVYSELIDRFYDIAEKEGIEVFSSKKITLIQPKLARDRRKTYIVNFRQICHSLFRKEKDVMNFILEEYMVNGTCDSLGRLLLFGIYRVKDIQCILKKYVMSYVVCKNVNCHGLTVMERDSKTRLNILTCLNCKAQTVLKLYL